MMLAVLSLSVLSLLLFAGFFITMLGALMASLPWRSRLGLTLALSLAFVVLGLRSPNPTLSGAILGVCPTMTVLAAAVGTLRARRGGQESPSRLGTKR